MDHVDHLNQTQCCIHTPKTMLKTLKLLYSHNINKLSAHITNYNCMIYNKDFSHIYIDLYLRQILFAILKNKSIFRIRPPSQPTTDPQNKIFRYLDVTAYPLHYHKIDNCYEHYSIKYDSFYDRHLKNLPTWYHLEHHTELYIDKYLLRKKNISLNYPIFVLFYFDVKTHIQIPIPYEFLLTHFVLSPEQKSALTNREIILLSEFK